MDSSAVARFNTQRVQPKAHRFLPREKGGHYGRCCVFHEEHAVHSTTPADNVVLFGGRRKR